MMFFFSSFVGPCVSAFLGLGVSFHILFLKEIIAVRVYAQDSNIVDAEETERNMVCLFDR